MGKLLALTVIQAARVLGCAKNTVYRRVEADKLKAKTIRDQLMIPLSSLKGKIDQVCYDHVKKCLEAGEPPLPPAEKPAKKAAKKAAAKRPCKKVVGKKWAKR